MIKPTIGRVVWYTPDPNSASPNFNCNASGSNLPKHMAAMVVNVWSDSRVNLIVFDHSGNPHPRHSVLLVQENEPKPDNQGYCEWMPYQIGQAKAQAGDCDKASR